MKQFADDNFICNENGKKFSKWVENTLGKGEIARYKQFLLFSQYSQKSLVLQIHKTQGLVGKGLKGKHRILPFSKFSSTPSSAFITNEQFPEKQIQTSRITSC